MKTQIKMNKASKNLVLIFLIGVFSFTACKKSSTGTGQLNLKFNALNSGSVKTSSSGSLQTSSVETMGVPTGITWTEGYAYVSDVEFKAVKDTTHLKYEAEGLTKVNLFNASSVIPNNFVIPSGTYNEIKLEVQIGNPTNSTDPGIYLKGTYGTTPIVFAYDESGNQFEFEVEGHNFTFDNTKDYNALINMHLNLLLGGVSNTDLDNATKTNGVILINHTTNTTIYQHITQNIDHISDADFQD